MTVVQVSGAIEVGAGNDGAFAAWDGDEGAWWAAEAYHYERSVGVHTEPLFEAADLGPGEHVLDIGCGTGQTTRLAGLLVADGAALGVDLSARMLEVARRRAAEEGLANVVHLQADAQVHPFEDGRFDAAISRTGTMFFADPVAAFANIRGALRPGGRLALVVWRSPDENPWAQELIAAATGGPPPTGTPPGPGPFAMADPDVAAAVLGAAGFLEVELTPVDGPMWFGATPDEALRFVSGMGFARGVLSGPDITARDQAREALRRTIDAHATVEGVLYPSATWVVTASRPPS